MIKGIIIFIIFLCPLIFFHELGHFLVARLFGVRVEVFSLGFGPKLFKFVRKGTEYAFSLIPLGGYVKMFGDEMSDTEIDFIYNNSMKGSQIYDEEWTFNEAENKSGNTISVYHCTWKDLRRMGFLTYLDEQGQEQMTTVSEDYKMDPDLGDISIDWEWIPETYETYIVQNDI